MGQRAIGHPTGRGQARRVPLLSMLRSVLLGYCPNCMLGRIFTGVFKPCGSCDVCGMHFESNGATWTATSFIMYTLICVVLGAEGLILGLLFGIFPGFMVVLFASALLLLVLFYRPVRGLWVWCLWRTGFLDR